MDQLVNYINQRIAAGISVQDIIADLKNRNFDDQTINQAFGLAYQLRATLQPSIPTIQQPTAQAQPETASPPVMSQSPSPEQNDMAPVSIRPSQMPEAPHRNIDATKVFVIIGAILIVAAAITVIASEWSKVGPLARVSFLLIPMLGLFAMTYFLAKKSELREYYKWTLSLGYLLLPGVLGTFFFQYKIVSQIDTELFVSTLAITLAVYLITEFVFKKYFIAALSIIGVFCLTGALVIQADLRAVPIAWIYLSLSLLILLLGFRHTIKKVPSNRVYLTFGTIALMITLPTAFLISINESSYIEESVNMAIFSLFGLAYLALASFYNRMHLKLQEPALYSLKRFAEEIAPCIIIFPYLYAGTSHSGYLVAGLVFSLIAIIVSIRVWINSLLYLGAIGLITSILMISSEIFADSTGWPIVVFIAGFAAIGLGLFIRKVVGIRKTSIREELPFGLGKDPSEPKNIISPGRVVLWIIVSLGITFGIWQGVTALYEMRAEQTWDIEQSPPFIDDSIPATPANSDSSNSVADNSQSTDFIIVEGTITKYNYLPDGPASTATDQSGNYVRITDDGGKMIEASINKQTTFWNDQGQELTPAEAVGSFKDSTYLELSYYNDQNRNLADSVTFKR